MLGVRLCTQGSCMWFPIVRGLRLIALPAHINRCWAHPSFHYFLAASFWSGSNTGENYFKNQQAVAQRPRTFLRRLSTRKLTQTSTIFLQPIPRRLLFYGNQETNADLYCLLASRKLTKTSTVFRQPRNYSRHLLFSGNQETNADIYRFLATKKLLHTSTVFWQPETNADLYCLPATRKLTQTSTDFWQPGNEQQMYTVFWQPGI